MRITDIKPIPKYIVAKIKQADKKSKSKSRCRHFLSTAHIAATKCTGDIVCRTVTTKKSECLYNRHQRHNNSNRRNHTVALKLANKKRVCEVVKRSNKHTDNRWYRKGSNQFLNGLGCHFYIFCILLQRNHLVFIVTLQDAFCNKNPIRRLFLSVPSTSTQQKNHPSGWFFYWWRRRDSMTLNVLRGQDVIVCYANQREFLSVPSISTQQKNHPSGWFFVGGEGEIRTLEPSYRLHDFQSCALDQLGDFSLLLFASLYIIS